MRRTITGRSWLASMSAGLLAVLCAAGCVNGKMAAIPPPEYQCPTDADLDALADWAPETVEAEMTAMRYRQAQAYCRMAERRLR